MDREVDQLELELLEELECPICTDYLTLPIRQCELGHSICGKCIERLEQCALCRSPFTEARNFNLEGLAVKMKYPCINKDAGCTELLTYAKREEHEMKCSFQGFQITCQMKGCAFVGDPASLKYHWREKKSTSKIYGAVNRCATKIKRESYYVNLLEAFNQMFWFKSKISNNLIHFTMQYIGKPEYANKFFFQIEISHEEHNKKKIILSDYCKSMILSNEELFEEDSCIPVPIRSIKQFVINDELNLFYSLRVFKVASESRKKRGNQNARRPNNQNNAQKRVQQHPVEIENVTRDALTNNASTGGRPQMEEDQYFDGCCQYCVIS